MGPIPGLSVNIVEKSCAHARGRENLVAQEQRGIGRRSAENPLQIPRESGANRMEMKMQS
jgi:hypothetical protein